METPPPHSGRDLMPGFGRRVEFDERSRQYPIRALLGPSQLPQTNQWPLTLTLDQGNVGACVGFAWSHELAADPEPVADIDNTYGLSIYRRAQQLDQWEGEDYEGTSVLAGAKAIVETGWITEYRWAFGIDDVLETLSYFGPVILGINWYSGMMRTNTNCYLTVSGNVVGGHAIIARGIATTSQAILLHNSWGDDWGCNGTAWLPYGELDRLLREDGEACVPVFRTSVTPLEPEPVPPEPEPVEPLEPGDPAGCLPKPLQRWFAR